MSESGREPPQGRRFTENRFPRSLQEAGSKVQPAGSQSKVDPKLKLGF